MYYDSISSVLPIPLVIALPHKNSALSFQKYLLSSFYTFNFFSFLFFQQFISEYLNFPFLFFQINAKNDTLSYCDAYIIPTLSGTLRKNSSELKMDASTAARLRKRFWFVFIVLFVLWYLLLYVVDWSALPGRTSTAENFQSEAIQSHPADPLDATTEIPSSHGQDNVRVHEETPPPEKKGDLVPDLDGLEKELEPLLKQNNGKSSCSGRYVYMHDLPARFNDDLIKQCKLLDPWVDMCAYTANQGLGMEVGNPGKIVQARDWFYTHQFSLEPIFHARMKQYDCLTNDSYKAAAVFVPYYAGFDVARYLWADFNASVLDSGARDLVNWLRERPEWKVMWGKDHFFIAGRVTWDFRRLGTTWGNSLLVMPESQNMSALTIESSPWDKNDFAIPYPTDYHPSSDEEVAQWQSKMRKQRRGTLFSFAGAERPSMQVGRDINWVNPLFCRLFNFFVRLSCPNLKLHVRLIG